MGEFFLRLLGAPASGGGKISGASIGLQPGVPVALALAAFVLLALLAFWLYAKTPHDVSRPRRIIMATLRTLFFGLLLLLLLRPTLDLKIEKENRRTLLGLVDSSASFDIRDSGTSSRLEQATAAFTETGLVAKLEEDLNLAFYSFDKSFVELDLDKLGELAATGQDTALGNSLRGLLNRRRGEPIAGIFLTTDGVNTLGESPLDAASALRDAGVPLYIYGVGATEIHDIAIESVDVAATSLVGDAVPVTVRVRSRGMAGRTARVALTLAGTPAAAKDITFGDDGTADVSLAFLPNVTGDFELAASVESDTQEIHPDNNRWSRQLRVLDSRIRVLMIEQSPRWEFKYIQAMLLREERVDLDCLVFEADPDVTRTPGSPYIESFPQRREDLYKYDLIILGDVDPKSLNATQFEGIAAFVSDASGSLAVLAGKRFMPQAYRHSPLAALLPVEPQPAATGQAADATRALQLKPTALGLKSPMLQLEDTPEASLIRWQKLPPIYWTAKVVRAKPAAQVLLINPLDQSPILAMQRYGSGEVLYLGTDNTWRWRKNVGDLYHSTFWGQVVQRLAGARLAAGSRHTQLRIDRQTYQTGQRVTVYAKLATQSWDPVREETVRATLQDENGERREVLLRAVPEEPGQFRAEFSAPEAGRYRLSVASDPDSLIDLTVRPPEAELANPALDEKLLQELATLTNGQYFTAETLGEFPAAIAEKSVISTSQRQVELWASPLMFLLLIAIVTTEWVMRKFAELK